jgi:hypothetical protein
MANDLSEKCKERLREIEHHLTRIFSDPANERGHVISLYPLLRDLIISARDDVDEQCKEVLRGIEPEINYLFRAKERAVPPEAIPIELLVCILWRVHAEFQNVVRYRLAR